VAVSAKPAQAIARAPREDVSDTTLSSGLVPKLSISFSDGSTWSMDIPLVGQEQGDSNRLVELLRG
jgi:hypothetical protein